MFRFYFAFAFPICNLVDSLSTNLGSNLSANFEFNDGIVWNIYTRNNLDTPFTNLSRINARKPLKMFIGGYLSVPTAPEFLIQKSIYLNKEDCNVIIIDWSLYNKDYLSAVFVIRKLLGIFIGSQIFNVYSQQNASLNNTHILGHSLGAHAAGFAGKEMIRLSGGAQKIARITGWDPALPLIDIFNPYERLDKGDAVFVDVHHSDSYKFGLPNAIGHVDYYPNGGTAVQPGCYEVVADVIKTAYGNDSVFFCSHSKCREYYRKSITNSSIYATQCDSYLNFKLGNCNKNKKIIFGESTPWNATEKYFLDIE